MPEPQDEVIAMVEDPPAPPVEAKTKAKGMPKLIKIILDEHDDIPPTGLFVGHNGRGYLLRPGEEMMVPAYICEILDHAIKDNPVVDPQTRQVIGYRPAARFPYRRLS